MHIRFIKDILLNIIHTTTDNSGKMIINEYDYQIKAGRTYKVESCDESKTSGNSPLFDIEFAKDCSIKGIAIGVDKSAISITPTGGASYSSPKKKASRRGGGCCG